MKLYDAVLHVNNIPAQEKLEIQGEVNAQTIGKAIVNKMNLTLDSIVFQNTCIFTDISDDELIVCYIFETVDHKNTYFAQLSYRAA